MKTSVASLLGSFTHSLYFFGKGDSTMSNTADSDRPDAIAAFQSGTKFVARMGSTLYVQSALIFAECHVGEGDKITSFTIFNPVVAMGDRIAAGLAWSYIQGYHIKDGTYILSETVNGRGEVTEDFASLCPWRDIFGEVYRSSTLFGYTPMEIEGWSLVVVMESHATGDKPTLITITPLVSPIGRDTRLTKLNFSSDRRRNR